MLCTFFLISVTTTAYGKITNDQKKLIIDEQLQLAEGLTARGYYKQAINEYEDIIKRFPGNKFTQEAWSQLAYTQSRVGEKEAALNTYNTFLTKYPDSPIYIAVKINYASLLGSFDVKEKAETAIRILNEIINSETVSEQLKEAASFYIAEIYNKTNKLETAKDIYTKLGEKALNNKNVYRAFALLKTAKLYSEENQQEKAIDIYNTLIENKKLKEEITIEAFQSLAVLYTNRKMYEQAANTYKKLILRFPKTEQGGQAIYFRLECLFQAKKYNMLIQEVDKLLTSSLALNRERLFFIKACTLQQQSLYAAAYKIFLKVLDKKKSSDFYRQSAIQSIICLLKVQKNSEAMIAAIKFSDDMFLSQNVKEIIYSSVAENIKKNSKLISFWEKAIGSIADKKLKVWIEYRLALCYEKANLPSKALSCYNNIIKNKDIKIYPYALNGIISCNLTLEEYEEADKYLDKIITEYSNSTFLPNAVLTKTEIYIRNKKYNEAFNILNKYKNRLMESQAWARAVYYFGCLNYIRENWNKAEENFKKILSNDTLSVHEQVESKLYLGLIYIEKDNIKEAKKLLSPIIKQKSVLNYCNYDTILKLGYFFLKIKSYEIAEQCFYKIIDNKDNDILQEVFVGLADTKLAQNNLSSAIKYYKKAAFVKSSSSDTNIVLSKLGKILLADNKDEEALLIFQKILENPIDSASTIEARMGMAKILAKQPNRILKANRYAMSVFILSKNPKLCIEAMLLSIKLSIQAKKFKEAENTWNELTKRFPESLENEEVQLKRSIIMNK